MKIPTFDLNITRTFAVLFVLSVLCGFFSFTEVATCSPVIEKAQSAFCNFSTFMVIISGGLLVLRSLWKG